ncbi:MAG: 4Fe-4S cluster-binding domain-containing protein, partial [Clostridia bacterium]|nr:4Fe-4S cluster-binding domain-containing protein [Clostridia bacterium]
MKIRLAGIVDESIVDGRGIRMTVFTQGCPHHCPGCHNPQTHDFEGGTEEDTDEIFERFCENPLLRGITFSGGEPFCQPEP